MVSVGLDYRFCELSFNSVLTLQIVSKCRSVFMSCTCMFEHCFIIELFGLMTAIFK